jgi:rhamnosyl/mannosyltransferase
MPKITHFFKTFFPDTQGGLEEAIKQIAKYSLKNNYDVRVVTQSENPQRLFIEGVEVISFKKSIKNDSAPFSFSLLKDFKSIIKDTDILQLHFPSTQEELMVALTKINKPLIITFHCDIFKWPLLKSIYSPFPKRVLAKADYIVPTSENLLNSTDLIKKYKDKSRIINLWLDETRFNNLPAPDEHFQEQVKSYGEFALFVGVLRWYKGLTNLIEAAKSVKGNIVIVGKGPLLDKLQEKVRYENINNVYLLGYQTDKNVKFLLKMCKFFILPSVSPAEAFGQVLLESSYLGKPMISTELGTGTSYVNLHNETGYVIEPNNINQLKEKMNILFTNNEKSIEFGKNAYERYKKLFIEDVQGPRYLELYNKLMEK